MHGQVRTNGIYFGGQTSNDGISNSAFNVENTILSNNTGGNVLHSGFNASQYQTATEFNSEIIIVNDLANNQYFWINDSIINTSECDISYSSSPHHCSPIILDGPTLTVTNTPYYAPREMEDIVSGEIIRKWNLEVRVTDPDLQWTPNANVTVPKLIIGT
jgi:hypothetical protein